VVALVTVEEIRAELKVLEAEYDRLCQLLRVRQAEAEERKAAYVESFQVPDGVHLRRDGYSGPLSETP
jgi:hypothetical protein